MSFLLFPSLDRKNLDAWTAVVGGPCDPEQVVGQQCGVSATSAPAFCSSAFVCGGASAQCESTRSVLFSNTVLLTHAQAIPAATEANVNRVRFGPAFYTEKDATKETERPYRHLRPLGDLYSTSHRLRWSQSIPSRRQTPSSFRTSSPQGTSSSESTGFARCRRRWWTSGLLEEGDGLRFGS